MNWNVISAIADFIAATGVIVSLIYLAQQVRAGNRATAVSAKLDATAWYSGFLKFSLENPDLDEMIYRGRKGLEFIEKSEKRRFYNFILFIFSGHSGCYYQHSRGLLDDEQYFESLATLRFWLRGPGVIEWWEDNGKYCFGPKFVAFVDEQRNHNKQSQQDA